MKPCIFVSVKTLTLIRHAHTEPGLNKSDIERSLNQIGHQEAEKQSNTLPLQEHALLLISPANRTKETAAYWLKKQPKLRHLFVSQLYNADLDTLLNCIESHFDEEHLVVIAHNPGISELYQFFTGQWEAFAPCTIAVLYYDEKAQNLEKGKATTLALQYP